MGIEIRKSGRTDKQAWCHCGRSVLKRRYCVEVQLERGRSEKQGDLHWFLPRKTLHSHAGEGRRGRRLWEQEERGTGVGEEEVAEAGRKGGDWKRILLFESSGDTDSGYKILIPPHPAQQRVEWRHFSDLSERSRLSDDWKVGGSNPIPVCHWATRLNLYCFYSGKPPPFSVWAAQCFCLTRQMRDFLHWRFLAWWWVRKSVSIIPFWYTT